MNGAQERVTEMVDGLLRVRQIHWAVVMVMVAGPGHLLGVAVTLTWLDTVLQAEPEQCVGLCAAHRTSQRDTLGQMRTERPACSSVMATG